MGPEGDGSVASPEDRAMNLADRDVRLVGMLDEEEE